MVAARRALDDLYRGHAAEVYRYAYAVLGNHADAEDVTQTTFVNALRALERGERPRKPSNWLITITHNIVRQRFRQQQARPTEVELVRDVAEEPAESDGPVDGGARPRAPADPPEPARGARAARARGAVVRRDRGDPQPHEERARDPPLPRPPLPRGRARERGDVRSGGARPVAAARRPTLPQGAQAAPRSHRRMPGLRAPPGRPRASNGGRSRALPSSRFPSRSRSSKARRAPRRQPGCRRSARPAPGAVVGGGAATGGGFSLGGLAVGGVALKAAVVVAAVSVAGGVGYVGVEKARERSQPRSTPPPQRRSRMRAQRPARSRRRTERQAQSSRSAGAKAATPASAAATKNAPRRSRRRVPHSRPGRARVGSASEHVKPAQAVSEARRRLIRRRRPRLPTSRSAHADKPASAPTAAKPEAKANGPSNGNATAGTETRPTGTSGDGTGQGGAGAGQATVACDTGHARQPGHHRERLRHPRRRQRRRRPRSSVRTAPTRPTTPAAGAKDNDKSK